MSHVRHVRVTCSNWLPPLALMSILSFLSRLRESCSNKIRVGCNVFWSSDWRGTVEMSWVVWWWWYETQETTISTDFSSSPPTVSINHNNKQSLVAALITTHLPNSCLLDCRHHEENEAGLWFLTFCVSPSFIGCRKHNLLHQANLRVGDSSLMKTISWFISWKLFGSDAAAGDESLLFVPVFPSLTGHCSSRWSCLAPAPTTQNINTLHSEQGWRPRKLISKYFLSIKFGQKINALNSCFSISWRH